MSEYYTSKAFIKSNSQYLNIKKYLQRGPYFSCSSKCECFFFFFRSNNVVQRSSRHCQSGGIRTHETPGRFKFFVRLGTSLIFFLHSSVYKSKWRIPSTFSFTRFSLSAFRNFSTNFYYALSVFLEYRIRHN